MKAYVIFFERSIIGGAENVFTSRALPVMSTVFKSPKLDYNDLNKLSKGNFTVLLLTKLDTATPPAMKIIGNVAKKMYSIFL